MIYANLKKNDINTFHQDIQVPTIGYDLSFSPFVVCYHILPSLQNTQKRKKN